MNLHSLQSTKRGIEPDARKQTRCFLPCQNFMAHFNFPHTFLTIATHLPLLPRHSELAAISLPSLNLRSFKYTSRIT